MTTPLSPEQRSLVEQNLGLAHGIALDFARRRRLQHADREIARSVALERLCLASAGYSPSLGKFSTYAGCCIRRAIHAEFGCREVVSVPSWTLTRAYARRPAMADVRRARRIRFAGRGMDMLAPLPSRYDFALDTLTDPQALL